MDIWIDNKIGYLEGYYLMEQPNLIKITVATEPMDFTNWRWDGINLIHDADNAPLPAPETPSDVDLLKQQNAKLTLTLTNMQKQQAQANKTIAQLMLEIEQSKKGDDKHAN
ncbi:hypothetical protein MEPL4_4c00200 [Melissococcus plutonius]|uniref:hypothetical protein n=1 Tax=Melissococcus plutonius TaxID=33970 RepID=UPI00065DE393|nr:hypothetical protein [Melissococcus plutonius]AIM25747.1 hypothetical protein MEPL_c010000 [Melissococcus plutonius S1]KMT23431.1 hypothetical protein MEPL2_43p00130 [Melissococcus plutonius]KMT25189.1 hypothetical protein MEPL2_2c07470 [Melissococcus plutonius]KMT26095.1 hypothetical protein MEPL3_3c00200 [Melissococcus plutonius]KMT26825.1 hypothetical protein MEPL1_4c00200 [Melissococcus plutonius]